MNSSNGTLEERTEERDESGEGQCESWFVSKKLTFKSEIPSALSLAILRTFDIHMRRRREREGGEERRQGTYFFIIKRSCDAIAQDLDD